MCAFKDVCSGRIVGYSISDRMTAQLAVRALDNAVIGRDKVGTIVHSDRGSQFRSRGDCQTSGVTDLAHCWCG